MDEFDECILQSRMDAPLSVIKPEGYINNEELFHVYCLKKDGFTKEMAQMIKRLVDDCEKLLLEVKTDKNKNIMKVKIFEYY